MRDYTELVKRLKESDDNCNAECFECSGECLSSGCNIFSEAADAIDELLAAFCLLCGIFTSPPSAETFNSCEIVRGCLPELSKEVQDG